MEHSSGVYLEGTNGYKQTVGLNAPTVNQNPQTNKKAIEDYKWENGDVLVCTYPKCGTHLIWEIVQMLLNNTAQLLDMPKEVAMMEFVPVTESSKYIQSPKAINTHLRLDVLPLEFQNRKTITVIRNPKDAAVSGFHHYKQIVDLLEKATPGAPKTEMSVEGHLNKVLSECPEKSSYWTFHSHMWKRKHDPNLLILFYEDLVMNPLVEIEKVNRFLGVNRTPVLLQEISEATRFDNMKKGKEPSERFSEKLLLTQKAIDVIEAKKTGFHLYRKGKIGDWKNHLTLSQNERFDQFISDWKLKYGLEDLHFTFE